MLVKHIRQTVLKILESRKEQEIEKNGSFSDKQYGFRKCRSPIHGLNRIINISKGSDKTASYIINSLSYKKIKIGEITLKLTVGATRINFGSNTTESPL